MTAIAYWNKFFRYLYEALAFNLQNFVLLNNNQSCNFCMLIMLIRKNINVVNTQIKKKVLDLRNFFFVGVSGYGVLSFDNVELTYKTAMLTILPKLKIHIMSFHTLATPRLNNLHTTDNIRAYLS